MGLLEILLVPFLIGFGILTSYQDHRHNRIRNKWVVLALVYSLLVLLAVGYYMHYLGQPLNPKYFSEYFFNLFFALFSGLIMWFAGLWSAGDAKLFVGYSALIPLSVYKWGYVQHFPSFIVLVNTFFPFFIFYLVRLVVKTTSKEKLGIVKEMLAPKFVLTSMLFVFAFWWLLTVSIRSVESYSAILGNYFVVTALLFLLLFFLNIFRIKLVIVSGFIGILQVLFDYKTILTMQYLKNFSILVVLFIFLRYFVINLGYRFFSRQVFIEDIKPGMIPAENIIEQGGVYKKKKFAAMDFIGALLDSTEKNKMFHLVSEGLSKEEVEKIKQLHSQGRIKDHTVVIAHTMSFAPFMLVGVVLTLLCQGSFVVLLRVLMGG